MYEVREHRMSQHFQETLAHLDNKLFVIFFPKVMRAARDLLYGKCLQGQENEGKQLGACHVES